MTALPRPFGQPHAPPPRLAEIYNQHFPFVFRTVRRLGVPDAAVDDVVQEVFLVVHRRFDELAWSSSVETLLFGIALRVCRDHRRALERRRRSLPETREPEVLENVPHGDGRPDDQLERVQARRLLHALLDQLDDDKRAIFVSVELEQLSVPEVARVMNLKLNTAYTKLRAARQEFDRALGRFRIMKGGRL